MALHTDTLPDTGSRDDRLWQLAEWRIIERHGIDRLERTYPFRNFPEALAFTARVGEAAEAAHHHPAIQTEWGRVTVTWWTHSAGGLALRDFEMAAATDALQERNRIGHTEQPPG